MITLQYIYIYAYYVVVRIVRWAPPRLPAWVLSRLLPPPLPSGLLHPPSPPLLSPPHALPCTPLPSPLLPPSPLPHGDDDGFSDGDVISYFMLSVGRSGDNWEAGGFREAVEWAAAESAATERATAGRAMAGGSWATRAIPLTRSIIFESRDDVAGRQTSACVQGVTFFANRKHARETKKMPEAIRRRFNENRRCLRPWDKLQMK